MPSTQGPYYIGSVRRVPHRGDAYHYATVEPLIESDPTGLEWLASVRDATVRFPKRGYVHWHDAPVDLQSGSLWQFTIDEHPSAQRGDRPEQYQLQDPQEPIEVLDLRGWSDETGLRSTITGDGIPLTHVPLARRVLLWLASGVCVGPWILKTGAAPDQWILAGPDSHRDVARMPVFQLSEADINAVTFEGQRWFVSPPLRLGETVGIQNWASDAQVARSILGRLRKMDPDRVRAIGATDAVFREYLDLVESGRMGSTDPAVERARADRLRGVREAILRDTALLRETAESLLTTEPVRSEAELRVEAKISEEIRARQTEIEAAISGLDEHLSRLQENLEAKRAEDTELDAALLEKRRELEAIVTSFDQEVSARLEEIAHKPEAFFAEISVLRTALAPHPRTSTADEKRHRLGATHACAPAATVPEFAQTAQLADDAAVRRALVTHAGADGLSLHVILALHAAFVAGVVPVVTGSRGYDLLRAYAWAVAGARLHWIPIVSSNLEPHDLLGRFDLATRRILPAASGLLDVVRDATHSGRLHVVALEGFNRAPIEAYLSPILETVEAGRVGDVVRSIPLASPGLLDEDDAYGEFSRLAWPSTVLIACLPTEGTATLPVPRSAWRFLGLLDADDRDRPPMPLSLEGNSSPTPTEMTPTLWKDLRTSIQAHTACEGDEAIALARALSLSARDANDAARVLEVLSSNGLPTADATALAIAATLVARSSAEAKAIEDAMSAARVEAPGWRHVWMEAQRLRS